MTSDPRLPGNTDHGSTRCWLGLDGLIVTIALTLQVASGVAMGGEQDYLIIPNATNAVQFRLYTNASSAAGHLFNTFDIQGYGQTVLQAPGGTNLSQWLASPTNAQLHNLLVGGRGPDLMATNVARVVEQVSGDEWSYIALDLSPAYHGRLQEFKRGILYVEPDLFVIYDHLVASEPVDFDFVLHPPAATEVDKDWGDLRLKLGAAGMLVNTPSTKKVLRVWARTESPVDALLPGTVTMQIGPDAKLAELDLITVFAVHSAAHPEKYWFKLIESDTAVGARILRRNLPTIVAFKAHTQSTGSSLSGFGFEGPVGVGVFKPKKRPL